MRYQIQKYEQTNHENRELIARSEDLQDQAAVDTWANQVLVAQVPVEGYAFAPVPESHDWFIVDDEPQVEVEVKDDFNSRPSAPFNEVAKAELAASAKRRQELHNQLLQGE